MSSPKKEKKVLFMFPIHLLEHGRIPSGQPPKRGWVFLSLYPCQKSSTEDGHVVVRASSPMPMSQPESQWLWAGDGGTSSPVRFEASSPVAISISVLLWGWQQDAWPALPQGADPLLLHRRMLTWLQAAAQIMGIHIGLGDNTGHRHQHGSWLYQDHWPTRGPQLLQGSGATTRPQVPHISMDPKAEKLEDTSKASGNSTNRIVPHESRVSQHQRHGPPTLTWPLVA